ncbi:hypothetical protein AB5N19_06868 [Seiridium cardinale]|uniref:Uncharacterized protein n=1 Tax=Seiridium cardinale TaxID=138064 RepID=A0ABR2XK40_9PEZI
MLTQSVCLALLAAGGAFAKPCKKLSYSAVAASATTSSAPSYVASTTSGVSSYATSTTSSATISITTSAATSSTSSSTEASSTDSASSTLTESTTDSSTSSITSTASSAISETSSTESSTSSTTSTSSAYATPTFMVTVSGSNAVVDGTTMTNAPDGVDDEGIATFTNGAGYFTLSEDGVLADLSTGQIANTAPDQTTQAIYFNTAEIITQFGYDTCDCAIDSETSIISCNCGEVNTIFSMNSDDLELYIGDSVPEGSAAVTVSVVINSRE